MMSHDGTKEAKKKILKKKTNRRKGVLSIP
jgi:hypothetical protein